MSPCALPFRILQFHLIMSVHTRETFVYDIMNAIGRCSETMRATNDVKRD